MEQQNANTTSNVNSEAKAANEALLNGTIRQPKLYKFADGEFKVPAYYYCTKCGKKHAVARQTLINRVNNQFGGKLKDYLEHAECSDCKRTERQSAVKISDEEIIRRYNELQARQATANSEGGSEEVAE